MHLLVFFLIDALFKFSMLNVPEIFRWREGGDCLHLLNKTLKSFTKEIICWILDPKAGYLARTFKK